MNEPPDQTAVLSAANLLSPTGNDRAEVLLEDLRVLLERGVGVQEDDALLLQLLVDLVVDHLGLVLGRHARDQPGLLRLRDAELVVGVLDVGGQVVPRGGLLLGGADEVLDVVEVDVTQLGTPGGHRLAAEELVPLQPQVEHPLRLVLQPGDVGHDLGRETTLRRRTGHVGVRPAPLVAAQGGKVLVLGLPGADWPCGRRVLGLSHVEDCLSVVVRGTWVVQTPSPWAMVASRWTWTPSSRENARVSTSHSCGNRSATWATGQ